MRVASLASLLLAAGCAQPGRVDLTLRTSDELDITTIPEIELRLLDEDGAELEHATVAGGDLPSLPRAFERTAIDPGNEYVFEVEAAVGEDVCASGRVVGRSLPVQVPSDEDRAAATMYVACADAIAPTARATARVGYAAVWDAARGAAILVGGTSEVRTGIGTYHAEGLLDVVERYDVASGRFEEQPPLLDARWLPAALIDPSGRLLVIGGSRDNPFLPTDWLDTVEELDGELRRPKGLLDTQWGAPQATALSDGTLAILGIGFRGLGQPLVQASFYEAAAGTVPHDPIERDPAGTIVVPYPGRDRALVVGGGSEESPARPALVCAAGSCGCSEAPCLVEIGEDDPASWGPGPEWVQAAGVFVPCDEDGGGAAYVLGGQVQEEATDEVWCHRDDGTADAGGAFERVGTMRAPRTNHDVALVRGARLLVAGGTGEGAGVGERIAVSGCECTRFDAEDSVAVAIDPDLERVTHVLLGRTLTVLGDGTVLVTGKSAIVAGAGQLGLSASDEAWIYNPDLP